MKFWSPLFVSLLTLSAVSAQFQEAFDGHVGIEVLPDDYIENNAVIEAHNGPAPCNTFPEYRKIPINRAFYLGSTNPADLYKGARFLDINLCQQNGDIVDCESKETGKEILETVFKFARDTIEQFVVLHIKSETVNAKQLEELIDERCEPHTKATEGTEVFQKQECPFVYSYDIGKGGWPSMGEVVNYDPDMAQWVGDGEIVGVRTKFLVVADVTQVTGYLPAYFSFAFWRTTGLLKTLCKMPGGGIGLTLPANITNNEIEELLTKECNVNDTPYNAFLSYIITPITDYTLELLQRLMELNYEKWSGNYQPLKPSSLLSHKVARDEL